MSDHTLDVGLGFPQHFGLIIPLGLLWNFWLVFYFILLRYNVLFTIITELVVAAI